MRLGITRGNPGQHVGDGSESEDAGSALLRTLRCEMSRNLRGSTESALLWLQQRDDAGSERAVAESQCRCIEWQ